MNARQLLYLYGVRNGMSVFAIAGVCKLEVNDEPKVKFCDKEEELIVSASLYRTIRC